MVARMSTNASCRSRQAASGPKYARQTRSRKGRSGSSERGPSAERTSAGETVGGRIERRDVERSGAPDKNGSEPAETQGDVRASSSGLRGWVERPRGGRGTGAVKATGSYEGSLAEGRHPGLLEAPTVTGRCGRQSWSLSHQYHFGWIAQQDDTRSARTKVTCTA